MLGVLLAASSALAIAKHCVRLSFGLLGENGGNPLVSQGIVASGFWAQNVIVSGASYA
jgi:hypothetical protein